VVTEDLVVFTHAFCDARLEPPNKALVEVRAQLLRHRLVRGIANQDVSEPEAVVAREQGAVRANEFLADERHQVATHPRACRLRQQVGDGAPVEHASLDRRTFDHGPLLGLEAVDPRCQQRLNRRRDHELSVAAFRVHREQLFDKKRVTFRRLDDTGALGFRQRSLVDEALDQRGGIVLGERGNRDQCRIWPRV